MSSATHRMRDADFTALSAQSTLALRSSNRMPVLGLGSWQLKQDTVDTVVAAIKLGFRMIDTSGDYGTHAGIGAAMRHSGIKRDELYVTTKIEETDDAYQAARKNLGELQLDYVDLLLIHRPPPNGAGEDLWRGLMRAKQEDLTRDIGVSNYSIEQIDALIRSTGVAPAVNQIEWSPFGHSVRMWEYCRKLEIVIQACSPLTRASRLDDENLRAMAKRYRKTSAQLLIRWNLQLGVVPLPKANRLEHQLEDLDVFDFEISAADMTVLASLNERYSALGSLPYD